MNVTCRNILPIAYKIALTSSHGYKIILDAII